MKKNFKILFLAITCCIAMSIVIPAPVVDDTNTEETTTSDCIPFSNLDVPPFKQ